MTSPRSGAVELRPEAEAAWDEIRIGLSLHEGYWLAFVVGAQSRELAEFAERCRDLGRARAQPVDAITARDADDVPQVLRELVTPRDPLYATILDATAALVPVLQRLNERRDVVKAARPAPLIVGCPAGGDGIVRDTAPDLWSIRTMTVVVAPPPGATPFDPVPVLGDPFRWELVDGPAAAPSVDVEPALRRAAVAVGAERTAEALAAAREVLAGAVTPEDGPLGHAWLARALMLADEDREARRHALLALQSGVALGPESTADLLDLLADADDPDVAMPAVEALVNLRRADAVRRPESSDATRLLSVALYGLTKLYREQGRYENALTTANEDLDLTRRLHAALGDDPQTLRDLTLTLAQLTDLYSTSGRNDDALVTASEELDLSRRIHTILGDTPETLQDVAAALSHLADVRQDAGEYDVALGHAIEAVDVYRRMHTILGDTPDALHNLAAALYRLASIRSDEGYYDDAFVATTEALDLNRRTHTILGDTPQILQNLAHDLEQLAYLYAATTRYHEALDTASEALELSRRLRTTLGDTPQTLRDLALALGRVTDLQAAAGLQDRALATATEAVDLTRRLHTTVGDTPQALRDLAIALSRATNLHADAGRYDDALVTATEAVELTRRVRAAYGDAPRSLRHIAGTLNDITGLHSAANRHDDALATATEAVDLFRRVRTALGDDPRTLGDLSSALGRLGQVRTARSEDARSELTEALILNRRIRAAFGDTVVALREHRHSARQLAQSEEGAGDGLAALAHYGEALDADHALLDRFGAPHWTGEDEDLLAAVRRLDPDTSHPGDQGPRVAHEDPQATLGP